MPLYYDLITGKNLKFMEFQTTVSYFTRNNKLRTVLEHARKTSMCHIKYRSIRCARFI